MSFSKEKKDKVWNKGTKAAGDDGSQWRKGQCGAWIYYASYGKQSDYGWQIDHIKPKSRAGSDDLSNLRPLHWENNQRKADGNLKCAVTSSGSKNVKKK
ncbi:MAG: HNH endonuclease [Candidatus Bathyarchaeota archaeon]|nr:HNH endonuclease [Candidatus Bathyarchaeota archaeon]